MRRLALGSVMLALGLLTSSPSRADDEVHEVDLKALPAAVAKSAEKAAPGAKLAKAYRYRVEGTTLFVVVGTDRKGREIAVTSDGAGTVEQVETTIGFDDLPADVRDVATRLLDGRPYSRVKAIGPTAERVDAYEFEGKGDRGESLGSILSIAARRR